MKTNTFFKVFLMGITLATITPIAAAPAPQKQILICVSDNASAAIKAAVADLVASADQVPVLKGLQDVEGAGPVIQVSSETLLKDPNRAAYNHLVVIGLKSEDPLVDKVFEHYVSVDENGHTFYAQGWGWMKGDIGYIEGDRNPFLHSRRIMSAPFETVLFKITGTDEAGVLAAVRAFKVGSMLNGFVPAGPITRPRTTLLDLNPLTTPAGITLPSTVPFTDHTGTASNAPLVGWTQVPGNEYRAFIDAVGVEPLHVWRYKYLAPHAFDQAGVTGWMAGFQRMAYGNSVDVVEFHSVDEAAKAAATIGHSGNGWNPSRIDPGKPVWQTNQPTDEVMTESLGKIYAFSSGPYLLLSSLPDAATVRIIQAATPTP